MKSTKGKITVKHYLNHRAKPKILDGKRYFPLYLQLIVAGHKAQIKSKIQDYIDPYRGSIQQHNPDKKQALLMTEGYFTEDLLSEIRKKNLAPFNTLLEDEVRIITSIIKSNRPFQNNTFTLVNFGQLYEHYLRDIYEILEAAVKKYYINELNRIFLAATKKESSRKLFKVTNYFIHFINWNNNFFDYYENTYEVLPSEIKFIENYFSEELMTQIKACLAFHSRSNYLKRFIDKTAKGLLPTVNYFDWQESGREFISREFTSLFGKQKASEYLSSIDFILSRELNPPVML
jgi:hypothetical protein